MDGRRLGNTVLREIVKDVWGDKVEKAYRGPRGQRQRVYVNLGRRQPAEENNLNGTYGHCNLLEELSDIVVPGGWKMVVDNPNSISFVRLESWEINNVRASTQLIVTKTQNSAILTVKSQGCQYDLADVVGTLPFKQRVYLAIEHLERSTFRSGFPLPNEGSLDVLQPHVIWSFNDLKSNKNPVTKVYSKQCKVFSAVKGGPCSVCSKLFKHHNLRKERKEKRVTNDPRCNKRYLSRDELSFLLKREKIEKANSEMRERYWKEKFADEFITIEDTDHTDLLTMFNDTEERKLPEEMLCLWNQQKRIMKTESKLGYRWHPK